MGCVFMVEIDVVEVIKINFEMDEFSEFMFDFVKIIVKYL